MKDAEHYFYKNAYHKGKNEREKWIPELIEELRKVGMEHKILDDLQKKAGSYEYKRSNSMIFQELIEHYLEIERMPEIQEIINNMWFGLWDSTEMKNAVVYNETFFDGSILVQFSTELEILIRKVTEIFSTVALHDSVLADGLPEKLIYKMFATEIHDIKNENEELGVAEYLSQLPDEISRVYNTTFSNVFKGACAFVLFHEVGHKLEVNTEIAKYFGVESSTKTTEGHQKNMIKEWNADNVSIQILIKIFGGDDVTDWMFYSGILVAFMALAINSRSLFEDTNHPALKNRYREAKRKIDKQLSKSVSDRIEFRLNVVGEMLSGVAKWDSKKWWLMNE